MSFFNSISEYVSHSVAGLTLSPKRFSLGRGESSETSISSSSGATTPIVPGRSNSADGACVNVPAGFPKVVPQPGAVGPLQLVPPQHGHPPRRSSTLEMPEITATAASRANSLRRRSPTGSGRPPPTFCRRRPSWPEVDERARSQCAELDGGRFEAFAALGAEGDRRRRTARREEDAAAAVAPPLISNNDEPLQLEVARDELFAEAAAAAAAAPCAQDELLDYARHALGFSSNEGRTDRRHPPALFLHVVVAEAEGLEAKDANGFSDPYCMLGIRPAPALTAVAPLSPQPPCSDGDNNDQHDGKLRKHHSFRLSFKRREGARGGSGTSTGSRDQRDSLGGAVPARIIRATAVRHHTLNPKWNEKFRFDIDDVHGDSLHLDIWDHDDESSVLEAVSRLNEVRGVRGLGRFFKQVCQSARQSCQDDFLGCVTVPLREVPPAGLEGWFALEPRSPRSGGAGQAAQGRIRLRLWLAARDGLETDGPADRWTALVRHEALCAAFCEYEAERERERGDNMEWSGEVAPAGVALLQLHAAGRDLGEVAAAAARFGASAAAYLRRPVDPRHLARRLSDLEAAWTEATGTRSALGRDEEAWLAERFAAAEARWLAEVRDHRRLHPALHPPSLARLEQLLRCLAHLSAMKAFWKCCPFNKEIRGEIVAALRKGTPLWLADLKARHRGDFADFLARVGAQLEHGLDRYHPLFEGINGVPYFSIVFRQADKLLADEVGAFLDEAEADARLDGADAAGASDREAARSLLVLAAYLEAREVAALGRHLPSAGGDHRLQLARAHERFEPAVARWLAGCRGAMLRRVRAACEARQPRPPPREPSRPPALHTTAAVDAVVAFRQLRDAWRQLQWPRAHSARPLAQLLDCVCAAAALYADATWRHLADSGYLTNSGGPYRLSDDMCLAANDLEHVHGFVSLLENYLDFATLETAVAAHQFAALASRLDATLAQLRSRLGEIARTVSPQMRDQLRKAVFHAAWSPDNLPPPDAAAPLLDYLATHLADLNAALLPAHFRRVLADVWEATVAELDAQADGVPSEGVDDTAPPPSADYHKRMLAVLELAGDFISKEGGLPVEIARGASYRRLEQRLRYHLTDTEGLVEAFHAQRLNDQAQAQETAGPGPPHPYYGTLTVRAYLHHDSLCVEVLRARDVIPLDPNGLSDPFVVVELVPRRAFPRCAEQRTHVHKRTLQPVFDECFEFGATVDQCRTPHACVAFTVMDHDVLTADDFAGEAFLPLATIPGVAVSHDSHQHQHAYPAALDNLHGLKPVDLVLMHQHRKDHPILRVLETRTGDRAAADFVRKQKQRFAT